MFSSKSNGDQCTITYACCVQIATEWIREMPLDPIPTTQMSCYPNGLDSLWFEYNYKQSTFQHQVFFISLVSTHCDSHEQAIFRSSWLKKSSSLRLTSHESCSKSLICAFHHRSVELFLGFPENLSGMDLRTHHFIGLLSYKVQISSRTWLFKLLDSILSFFYISTSEICKALIKEQMIHKLESWSHPIPFGYKSIDFADFTTPKFTYYFIPIRAQNTAWLKKYGWQNFGNQNMSYFCRQYFEFTTQGRSPKQALKSHKVTSSEMRLSHPWPLDFQYKDDSQRPET